MNIVKILYRLWIISWIGLTACRPSPQPPTCQVREILPRLTPAGAIDCGSLDAAWATAPSIADPRISCANNAIRQRLPFVLRLPGLIANPECAGSREFCPGLIVDRLAFVGEVVGSQYKLLHVQDGTTAPYTDSTQDAAVVDAGPVDLALRAVRQDCIRAEGAELHMYTRARSAFSRLSVRPLGAQRGLRSSIFLGPRRVCRRSGAHVIGTNGEHLATSASV